MGVHLILTSFLPFFFALPRSVSLFVPGFFFLFFLDSQIPRFNPPPPLLHVQYIVTHFSINCSRITLSRVIVNPSSYFFILFPENSNCCLELLILICFLNLILKFEYFSLRTFIFSAPLLLLRRPLERVAAFEFPVRLRSADYLSCAKTWWLFLPRAVFFLIPIQIYIEPKLRKKKHIFVKI